MMWIIWRELSSHIFEDMELTGDQLLALFAGILFDWSRVMKYISLNTSFLTYPKKNEQEYICL